MLNIGLFTFTESHIVKMLKICWFFPIQRCKMQICIQNMYFSLLLWNRCYLLSERLFQHFFFILQYCIEGLVSWVITLTWKVFRPNFVQKFKMHFFNNQKNPTELPFNSDQLPSQRSVNFKMFFGCHCLDQNTNKNFSGFLP